LREKFGHDATAREVTQFPIMIYSSLDNALTIVEFERSKKKQTKYKK